MALEDALWAGLTSVPYTHTYQPTIDINNTDQLRLPVPIGTVSERFGNRVEYSAVPFASGVKIHNATRGELTVSFSGVLVPFLLTGWRREDLLYIKDRLVAWLLDTGNVQTLSIFRYYDAQQQNYRWYEDVKVTDLHFDHTERTYGYTPWGFSILVPDGQVHELITTYSQ